MNALPVKTHGEERLRLALGAAGIGYWEWNPSTDKVTLGEHTENLFGLKPGAFKGTYKTFLELAHLDDRETVRQVMSRAVKERTKYQLEFRIVHPGSQGHWMAMAGRPYLDEAEKVSLMLGVVWDIHTPKQTEATLRQVEQLNQTVLDSMQEHIAVLDRNGNIVAVNRAWDDFTRDNGGDVCNRSGVGSNYLDICKNSSGKNGEEGPIVCAGIKDVLSGLLEHFTLEYPCHSSTRQRWFLLQVSPLSRERGGAVVTHLDITDRKLSETERIELLKEAQEAREIAEAANRAKDDFIAQITHNLRSPLNAILGWSKVLLSQTVDEKTAADALTTIQQSAEKQKHLIEELLEVSRMVNGNLRLDVGPVSLSAVIHSAMEVMRPACEARELDCETELATDADSISGDAARLEQVIWNLVSNAVKFTDNGGKVKVRLERADPYVQITVSDTGKGIKPAHLPHIFERYWQSDDSGKRPGGGLGLGLSFVRHIVELHGGTVRAESEGEGMGAKFIICLPYRAVRLQNNAEAPVAAHSRTTNDPADQDGASKNQGTIHFPSTLNGMLALIVDDEQDARNLVAAILRQYGAQVLIAASAAEALRLIRESPRMPDLLISDNSMPEEDGYSLIRKVRALPQDKGGQIPAIALTAYGRMEDRIRVLSAGFQRHVPKPVEPAELALSAAHLTGREIQHLEF
jgi:PAS domain S-box-containing protein